MFVSILNFLKKAPKWVLVTAVVLFVALLAFQIFSIVKIGINVKKGQREFEENMAVQKKICLNDDSKYITDEVFKVSFIDAGNNNCTLITNGEKSMVITGGKINENAIIDYLHREGVEKIDVLVSTDAKKDVIEKFNAGTVYVPDVTSTIASAVKAEAGQIITLGGAEFQFLSDSADIRMDFGKTSFIFMASEAEEDILYSGLDISATVISVSKNGREVNSQKFLNAVSPQYIVVSTDADNAPTDSEMYKLYNCGTVYRTDEDGTLTISTDGVNYRKQTTYTKTK